MEFNFNKSSRFKKPPKNPMTYQEALAAANDLTHTHEYPESVLTNALYCLRRYEIYAEFAGIPETDLFPLTPEKITAFMLSSRNDWGFKISSIVSLQVGLRRHEKMEFGRDTFADKSFEIPIRECIEGMQNINPDPPTIERIPLLSEIIYQMIDEWDYTSVKDYRDSAIIVLGNIMGCRCNSIERIDCGHLKFKLVVYGETPYIDVDVTLVRETRVINVTHKSERNHDPVFLSIRWLHSRGAFEFTGSIEELITNSLKNISLLQLKSSFINLPFCCSVKHGELSNDVRVRAAGISKMISNRATDYGYLPGEVTGHCLRRGMAAEIILHEMANPGIVRDNTINDIERLGGWVQNSKALPIYIKNLLDALRDKSSFVTGERTETANVEEIAIEAFSPKKVPQRMPDKLLGRSACGKRKRIETTAFFRAPELESEKTLSLKKSYKKETDEGLKHLKKNQYHQNKRVFRNSNLLDIFHQLDDTKQKELLYNTDTMYKEHREQLEVFGRMHSLSLEEMKRLKGKRLTNLFGDSAEEVRKLKVNFSAAKRIAKIKIATMIQRGLIKLNNEEEKVESKNESPDVWEDTNNE